MKKVLTIVLVITLLLSFTIALSEPSRWGTLAKGCKGEDVRQLQVALINLGYLPGSADGIYGNMTADSVAKFQLDNGLLSNGIADGATIELIYAKEAERLAGSSLGQGVPGTQPTPPTEPTPPTPR